MGSHGLLSAHDGNGRNISGFLRTCGTLYCTYKKLTQFKKHIKIKPIISVILAVVLFFGGIALAPQPDTTVPAETEDTVSTDAETVNAPITDSLKYTVNSETESEIRAEPAIEPAAEEDILPEVSEPTPEPEITVPVTEPEPFPEVTEEPIAEPTDESPSVPSTFSIQFIDVGQADAALVECDGHYMLIDGGNKADSDVIYAVLKNAGVQKLDIVVGTHAHEDHVGGLPGAFNYTTADRILCSVTSYDTDAFADFKKYADQNGGGITVPAVGDEYTLGSASVKILGVNGGSDVNDTSIVLKILYGETSFLFTGDAEREAEQEAEQTILNSGTDLSATVLKVGHHGSDTSTTYPFLREIMPQYAVISVGTGNSYGHPTDDTLSRLRDADVQIYRTDLHGDIYLTSDGTTVTITTDKTATDNQILTSGEIIVSEPEPTPVPAVKPEVSAGSMDYVLNTNSKKFHYPSCSSVKQMSEKNKAYYTGTRDEVIAMGYDPCGNCHP